jgi:hypothetical protein
MSIASYLNQDVEPKKPISRGISAVIDRMCYISLSTEVKWELSTAEKYASQGDAAGMCASLLLANDYALKKGRDITVRVAKIENVGYSNALPIALSNAKERADKGDAKGVNFFLALAHTYSNKIGQDIRAQVAEIRTVGWYNAVVNLNEGKSLLEQRL